ncbi:methyltransferase domain-containing protein [bacterium]|nr:methyltransferase domain-containing protein [bacterium]
MSEGPLTGDLARFSELLVSRVGLTGLDASTRLDRVLADRMRATACKTAEAYFALLLAPETADQEMFELAEQLTVGETYFFRNPEQFQALKEVVLPALARRPAPHRPVRMLSAGCSSGEEAYTLAMVAQESGLLRSGVRIEGIDLNGLALAKARRACYAPWSLRGVSPEITARYFRERRGDFVLAPAIREMVSFSLGNLMQLDRTTEPGAYDVIFCRNVLIYFSADAIRRQLESLARALSPGGYLFLGHAETTRLADTCFQVEQSHGTFYYRKQDPQSLRSSYARSAVTIPASPLPARPKPVARPVAIRPRTEAPAPQPGLARAYELFASERFVEAEAILRNLPPTVAEAQEALLLLGAVLLNTGRGEAVETVCRRALANDEFSAGAHYLRALYYEQAGELASAIKDYEAASYLEPGFSLPHLRLGLLAKRRGEHEQGRRALTQALALLPNENDARLALFGGGFGRTALEQLCRSELAREGRAL